jgi:hypothetical protein
VSRALAFESRLLVLEVFKVDVLEVLRRLVLYAMMQAENKQENKINKTV